MKKVIIVGSSKGYGAEISKVFHSNGFYTIGLSRKESMENFIDKELLITDVSNNALFSEEFENILKENTNIDTLIFVAGDVVLKQKEEYTESDFIYTLDTNIGYIIEAMNKILEKKIIVKNVITFGSQWSYKEVDGILFSYSLSKHLLKRFTELLNETNLNAFHFCVPTSKTEKALNINNYVKNQKQEFLISGQKWAEPKEITELIIEKFMNPSPKNCLYKFDNNGNTTPWTISVLDFEQDRIDKYMQEFTLNEFLKKDILYKFAKNLSTELQKERLLENKAKNV